MSKLFSLSILALDFLSTILFCDNIILFIEWRWSFPLYNISKTLSVKKFWDKLSVITPSIKGIIFAIVSSFSLLLINFTVLAFEPFKNSHIWMIVASPSYAFVKSTIYNWSLARPLSIFSYFSPTLIRANFFLFGLSIFYWTNDESFGFDLSVNWGLLLFSNYFFWDEFFSSFWLKLS